MIFLFLRIIVCIYFNGVTFILRIDYIIKNILHKFTVELQLGKRRIFDDSYTYNDNGIQENSYS